MSEADTPAAAGEGAAGGSGRTLVTRTATGAVVRWEAPYAEALTDVFPGLKVKSLCGVGGMGAVYRAEQTRLGRTVAVKILPQMATPDFSARDRFEREAKILSGINHPHVLRLHDFGGLPDGTLYIVMEWAGGGDLSKLMAGRAHPLEEVQGWVRQIAAALTETHRHGVIHRDLKPANVLVFEDGRLALADFGLAHAAGGGFTAPLTTTGTIFGTFEYMAPEQMESAGRVTPAADLYALGVMTYQMITGRVPRGSYTKPSRLVAVPGEVDAFLDAAMANDVERRPRSAAEFARRFEMACRAPQRRRRRQLIGLGVTLVLLALTVSRARTLREERAAEAARTEALAEAPAVVEATPPAAMEVTPSPTPAPTPTPELVVPVAEGSSPWVPPTPTPTLPAEPAPPTDEGDGGLLPRERLARELQRRQQQQQKRLPTEETTQPWTWVLPTVDPRQQALSGDWRMAGGELVSGEGRCVLKLPVKPARDYDIAVEFTRKTGRNSIAVFLPTTAGVAVFEVDAWDKGVAGLQLINGEDMRKHGLHFPARLKNGEQHRLILQVRADRVSATLDGESRMTWTLQGRRLRLPLNWQMEPEVGVALGSWSSATVFHRVAYRAVGADEEAGAGMAPEGVGPRTGPRL